MKKKFGLIVLSLLIVVLFLSACTGSRSLDGTSWQLDEYRDASGSLVPIAPDTVVTARFQATEISGTAGCNNYSGSFQVDGNQLAFSPLATTRKVCSDPSEIMDQENAYLSALGEVQEFRHRGDTLEMSDSNGNTLLVFSLAGQ